MFLGSGDLFILLVYFTVYEWQIVNKFLCIVQAQFITNDNAVPVSNKKFPLT